MNRIILSLSLLFCASLQTLAEGISNDFSAQAGWADVDITPPLGLPMGGRGPDSTVGKKVLDPLIAQVLYMKDGKGTGFVLVSLDLVGISHELSDRIRLDIVHELGVDWNMVVLNTSHTHAGPQTIYTLLAGVDGVPPKAADYFDTIEKNLVDATRAAAKAMTPVKVEVFEGKSQIAINRRGKNKKGIRAMAPDPDGPIAEKVWVMKLTPRGQKPPAIIFSYACHPVIVYEYAGASISPDFPGLTRKLLRENLGEGVHAQFVQGLAGDVRPRAMADLANHSFRRAKPEDLQAVGQQFTEDILATLKNPATLLHLNLAGDMRRPLLPHGAPPPRAQYETMLTNSNKGLQNVAKYWLERYDSGLGFAKDEAWPVGLIRLASNQWVCYFAGEPCVEWGPVVAQWLAPRNVVMWGYSQEAITYLPTEALLPQGGYEVLDCNRARATSPAPLAVGIEKAVHQSLLRQLAAIEANVK